MKISLNTNRWNRIRYTLYTPVYDVIAGLFRHSRSKSIQSLHIQPGHKILIVGAGTGLDLEHLPQHCEVIATDLTPAMVQRIKKRAYKTGLPVEAIVMDGHALQFEDAVFDKVILHLILAVIPDPVLCLQEVERVLKPGGMVTVFDKFIPKNSKVPLWRKGLNVLTRFLFTDITRDIETIANKTRLKILSDEKADFNGTFRIITLQKQIS